MNRIVQIPGGELINSTAPSISVRLRTELASKPELRRALDALAKLNPRQFLLPSVITDRGTSLEVSYIPENPRTAPLADHLPDDANRAVRLSLIVSCVQFVARAWQETLNNQPRLVPVSMPLIYGLPGTATPWRIMPIPAVGLSLGDWANAESQCWSALTADVVLSANANVDSSLLAALFLSIWSSDGDPMTMPDARRFRRLLSGRTVDFPSFEFGISDALPNSFGDETRELREWMTQLLQPDAAQRPAWNVASEQFEKIASQLSLERIISRWRYENKPNIADRLEALGQEFFGNPSKTITPTTQEDVPSAPLAEPLEQLFQRIREDGPAGVRRFLKMTMRMAAGGLDQVSLHLALNRLLDWDQQCLESALLDETAHLQIAHIYGRYLGVDEEMLRSTLNRAFESTWNAAVNIALRARLLSATDHYVKVSQLCQRGNELIRSMPDFGGSAGRYLQGYLQLLDGIANIGGAAKMKIPTFYVAAFEAFQKVWLSADDLGAVDLSEMSMRWMRQLARFTNLLVNTEFKFIHTGVVAFLGTQRASAGTTTDDGVPPIPWYDENRVLPG